MKITNNINASVINNIYINKKSSPWTSNYRTQDNVNFRGKEDIQNIAEQYKQSKNKPIESVLLTDSDRKEYSILKAAKSGDKNALNLLERAKELAFMDYDSIRASQDDNIIKHLAIVYKIECLNNQNKLNDINVYDNPRIYRTIGESEYQALLKGEHIFSPFRKEGVDVTNNSKGVNACTGKGKAYFVTFKLKDNLDAFISQLFDFEKEKIPHVHLKNASSSEFVLVGGYDLSDVENIKAFKNGKHVKTVYSEHKVLSSFTNLIKKILFKH